MLITNDFSLINVTKDQVWSRIKNERVEFLDGREIYYLSRFLKDRFPDLEKQLFFQYLDEGASDRYKQYLEHDMVQLHTDSFLMGNTPENSLIYLGEVPQREIKLSPFSISKRLVTNELYSEFKSSYVAKEKNKPATEVNWFDALIFSRWLGCTLPTEAQWEFASKASSKEQWCCSEDNLSEYSWFSENSKGTTFDVATKKPNSFGIYDMHGNVWEWCLDSYEENYYEFMPSLDPSNRSEKENKTCRGGSINGFSEMCRSAFRYGEPASLTAFDLGFRLAKNSEE